MIETPIQYLADGAIAPPPQIPGTRWVQILVQQGIYRYYENGDPLPELPPPTPESNWAQFRLGMLADPGFLRVVAYGMSIFQASLASEINQNPPNEPNVGAIALIWNQIIAGLPQGTEPTETEIEGWNAIATATHVPLTFLPNGAI